MRKFLFVTAMLLIVCFEGTIAIAQGQPEPTLALLRSGARPLVVGGVSEYTPFNVVGPDGQLTGMDREIIRAAAERLGIKQVDFKTMTFSKLGQSLLDGKIDLIANNYWPTPDRERSSAAEWVHCGSRGPDRSTLRPAWPRSVSPS
jgi:ABC-type amino acid transport substrate-binding protein